MTQKNAFGMFSFMWNSVRGKTNLWWWKSEEHLALGGYCLRGAFRGASIVLCLDLGDGFMSVFPCKTSITACILKYHLRIAIGRLNSRVDRMSEPFWKNQGNCLKHETERKGDKRYERSEIGDKMSRSLICPTEASEKKIKKKVSTNILELKENMSFRNE